MESYQEWIYAVCTALMLVALLLSYLYFFHGSEKRKQKIEQGGMIPFKDKPVEERNR